MKPMNRTLALILPINGFILAFVLWFFSNTSGWSNEFSIEAFSSPLIIVFAFISLLYLPIVLFLSKKILSLPSGELLLIAIPETIVVLGFVAAFLDKKFFLFFPFFALWLLVTAIALKMILFREE
jgi:hypothetical protein